MALTSQQIAQLNAAATRGTAEDLKNLAYAKKTYGFTPTVSMPNMEAPKPIVVAPKAPTPVPVSTSQSVAGPISNPLRPPTSSAALLNPSPLPQAPPSSSTQMMAPPQQVYRPVVQAPQQQSQPQQTNVPSDTPAFLRAAAAQATPREGYQVILPGQEGEFYDEYNETVGGYGLRFGKPVKRATFINQAGDRQSVRINEDLPDAQKLFSQGYRLEKSQGVPITPFGSEQIQTGAKTGISQGTIQLQAPGSADAFREFLGRQTVQGRTRNPDEVNKTLQDLNAAAMRDALGTSNATDKSNLAYAESRGYIRPNVSGQSQTEAIRRLTEPTPAPEAPIVPPTESAAPVMPKTQPDTLPAGAFGETKGTEGAAPSPVGAAQSPELTRAMQAQEKALQDLIAAMSESNKPSELETQLQSYQKQLADEDLRTQMGIANVQDQPIAASFLQGQSAAIQRQAGVRQQGIANQANLLQAQVAAEQARRQKNVALAQQRYELASEQAKTMREQYKPIEVNNALVRLNPVTGVFERVYGQDARAKVETVTSGGLSYERQADGTWKPIGTPKQEYQSGIVGEYQFYAEQEEKAGRKPLSFDAYQTQDANRKAIASKVNQAGLSTRDQIVIEQVNRSFENSPIVKNYIETQNKKATVDNILSTGLIGGPADLAIVYEFMKALDPNSVVRESEYAAASKSGNLFLGVWAKFNGLFKEEGGLLPDNVRKDFKALVDNKFTVSSQQYSNWREQKIREINNVTGRTDGSNFVPEYSGGYQTSQQTGTGTNAPPQSGSAQKITIADVENSMNQSLGDQKRASVQQIIDSVPNATVEDVRRILGFNTESQTSSKGIVANTPTAKIISVKPAGTKGGQCGEFVHALVSNYPYGKHTIEAKKSVINIPRTQIPKIGDVLVQDVGSKAGHVAVVNNVDPVNRTITLTESNYNFKSSPETVSHKRVLSLDNPTVAGFFRGTLKKAFQSNA